MDLESYIANFSQTTVNQDTSDWDLGYFLSLDRDGEGDVTHTLRVHNNHSQAQVVHVGAHVWQGRAYGWYNTSYRNCTNARYN
jgi:hypothetical protein